MSENVLPFPLSSPEKTIPEILNEVINQTLSRLTINREAYGQATGFMVELVSVTSLMVMLTVNGVETWQNKVFSHAGNRDLIMTIYSTFRARYATCQEDWNNLLETITDAVTIPAADNDLQYSIVPSEVNDRLFDRETCETLLRANHWLVVLVLVLLYWNATPTVVSALSNAGDGRPRVRG